jgi:hypothetical protein
MKGADPQHPNVYREVGKSLELNARIHLSAVWLLAVAIKAKPKSNADTCSKADANCHVVHRYAQCRPDSSPEGDAQRQRLSERLF